MRLPRKKISWLNQNQEKGNPAMKLVSLSVVAFAAAAIATLGTSAQTTAEPIVKIRGCLQGDGSPEKPWLLAGAILPVEAPAAPAAAAGRGGTPAAPPAAPPAPPTPPPA